MKLTITKILIIASPILLLGAIAWALMGKTAYALPIIVCVLAVLGMVACTFLCVRQKMRIVAAILAATYAIVGVSSMVFTFSFYVPPVPEYANRVEIWGDSVAGNSSQSKLVVMNYSPNARMLGAAIDYTSAIKGENYLDAERAVDTFTYVHCIKSKAEKTTFEDVPYFIPYLVKGSKKAVIVIPGGGFGYKSINEHNGEGKEVAQALNQRGISAFVLWYRSNPYEMPIQQIDLQRAVRYLRHHANDFGIDGNQISLLGMSAGGYLAGSFINGVQGNDYFPANYVQDEVDGASDAIAVAAMIYPYLTYKNNVPMLFAAVNDDALRNAQTRETVLDKTHLPAHYVASNVKQFVCYGTNDTTVGNEGTKEYIQVARNAGTDITEVVAYNQGHAFDTKYYIDKLVKIL